MKYLHICNDAPFIDFVIEQFETVNPGKNIFLVVLSSSNLSLRHISKRENIIVTSQNDPDFFNSIYKHQYDVLAIHFLDFYKADLVIKTPKNKQIIWFAWGADIYETGFFRNQLLQSMTQEIVKKIKKENIVITKAKKTFRNTYYFFKGKIPPAIKYKKAVSRIDFCATVIPDEINILKGLKFFNAIQVPFSYASIEDDFRKADFRNIFSEGDGVIIGNSNSPTSNHIDCFNAINLPSMLNKKFFVPLSYGNHDAYTKLVIHQGKKIFKDNFIALTDFLPKDDYIKLLQQCSIAIFAHERQQALGNIIIMLWLGIKVFLSENNLIYSFFKESGAFIFSVQKHLNEEVLNVSLTKEEVAINREILMREYSKKNVLTKAKTLLNIINQKTTNKFTG